MPSKTRSKGAPQAVGKWLVVDTDLAAASRELAKYKGKPIRWSEKAPSSAKFTVGYVLSEHAKPLVAIKVLGAVAVAHSDRAPVPKPGSEQEHLIKWIKRVETTPAHPGFGVLAEHESGDSDDEAVDGGAPKPAPRLLARELSHNLQPPALAG